MEVLPQRITARRSIFSYYQNRLAISGHFEFLNEPLQYFSNRWLTTLQINSNHAAHTPEYFRQALEKHNIETRPLWKPLHLQPVFKSYPAFITGISENLFNKGLCLPSGSALTEAELEQICTLLESALHA